MSCKTICDICINNDIPLRVKVDSDKFYCSMENGLRVLEGPYRKMTDNDEEEYNFKCLYRTPTEMHSRIFRNK